MSLRECSCCSQKAIPCPQYIIIYHIMKVFNIRGGMAGFNVRGRGLMKTLPADKQARHKIQSTLCLQPTATARA